MQLFRLPRTLAGALVAFLAVGVAIGQETQTRPLERFVKEVEKNGNQSDDADGGTTKPNGKKPSSGKTDRDKSANDKPDKKDGSSIPIHSDHIFHGDINRRGDIVGVHFIPTAPKQMRVNGKLCDLEIKKTSPGGEKEVVTAKVILRDPSTGKIVLEKFSTLFPSAWSKADVEDAIREAYAYAKAHDAIDGRGAFHGRTRGIKIDGYLTERGDAIATAYPVFQGSQTKPRTQGTHR